jgi:hypothetical protein
MVGDGAVIWASEAPATQRKLTQRRNGAEEDIVGGDSKLGGLAPGLRNDSMIEEEFLRVQQCPEDVFEGFLLRVKGFLVLLACGLFGDVILREFHLGGIRVTAEGDVIDVGDLIIFGASIFLCDQHGH